MLLFANVKEIKLLVISLTLTFCFKINLNFIIAEKMWVAFAKATHIFFSKNISVYAIFNDQSFNNTLTNDIISFE